MPVFACHLSVIIPSTWGRVAVRACSTVELPSTWLSDRWWPRCRARIFVCFPCCRWPAGCTWKWCASVVTSGRGLPGGMSPWMPPWIRRPRRTGSCAWWVLASFSGSTWFQHVSWEVVRFSKMEAYLLTPSVIAHWMEMDQTCHPVKDECVKVTVSEAAKENTVFLGKWASVTG